MPFTFPHRDITPCCDHDILENCTPVVDALSKCMWPSGLSRAAVACAGSLSAQAPYVSRSIDFRASPSLGSKGLLARSVCRSTRYTSSCRAMGKPDDPSQAFHGGQAKARSALDEMSTKGEFKRTDSTYRDHVTKGTRFEPEAGRYHLYIAYACPWASRCLAVRNLKGLEDAIGLSVTHSTWQRTKPDTDDEHCGWAFASPGDAPLHSSTGNGNFPTDDCIPDTVNGAKFVRDLYEKVNDTAGKYTVPILWDKKEKTIVNNESSEIMRMFNSEFNSIAKKPELDLYPEDLRSAIDEVNSWVYPTINNGVYRCGFATSQEAYENAFKELFASLDKAEQILSKQRFIAGDRFTEADLRLFVTLIRFDEVYAVYFKANRQLIREYENLRNYTAEIYQMPGIADSVNMQHIKMHYYTSHPKLNYYAVVPTGLMGSDDKKWWEKPHNRGK